MSHMAGSSIPVETERQVEDFMTEMHGLVARAVSDIKVSGAAQSGHADMPELTAEQADRGLPERDLYERDMLIYRRALSLGLGVAGQVASSADGRPEKT